MSNDKDYLSINKASWNRKTELHVNSEFYDNEGFIKGNTSLNEIELELFGKVEGLKILHLQCHFGQDTLSLSRLGAKVTGVDLSDVAIKNAKILAEQINQKASFICSDIYDLPNHLNEQFDIVYTSYGTIGWLPDLDKWAKVISRFLKPGGKFIFVEFHPVIWMFDDEFEKVAYNYFNTGPIIETLEGTYAEKEARLSQEYVNWNHSIAEVLSSLLGNSLEINDFKEYDYSPYDCFKHTVKIGLKKYQIEHFGNKIPMVYAVVATKRTP